MKNIGIVAEYNPFHNGHAYHIEQARKIAGGGSVIAVMSASFVQRGEPAAFDKFPNRHGSSGRRGYGA